MFAVTDIFSLFRDWQLDIVCATYLELCVFVEFIAAPLSWLCNPYQCWIYCTMNIIICERLSLNTSEMIKFSMPERCFLQWILGFYVTYFRSFSMPKHVIIFISHAVFISFFLLYANGSLFWGSRSLFLTGCTNVKMC